MAELVVTDGMPPPADLPDGEFIVHRVGDSIWIERADPRILISDGLLEAIAVHGTIADGTEALALNAQLDISGCMPPEWPSRFLTGAVLKISGANRQVS